MKSSQVDPSKDPIKERQSETNMKNEDPAEGSRDAVSGGETESTSSSQSGKMDGSSSQRSSEVESAKGSTDR